MTQDPSTMERCPRCLRRKPDMVIFFPDTSRLSEGTNLRMGDMMFVGRKICSSCGVTLDRAVQKGYDDASNANQGS